MGKQEWAKLLDSLRGDDAARSEALLMLSDEDWVADGEREWLRRESNRLTPASLDGQYGCNCAWVNGGGRTQPASVSRPALLPDHIWQRMEPDHTWVITKGWSLWEQAWLALLGAISREGTP